MNKTKYTLKLIIFIFIFVIFINKIYAECSLTSNVPGKLYLSLNNCNDLTCTFDMSKIGTDAINDDIIFTKHNCSYKQIELKLNTDLDLEIPSNYTSQENNILELSGDVDIFELNGYNINFKRKIENPISNVDYSLLKIDFEKIQNTSGNSEINLDDVPLCLELFSSNKPHELGLNLEVNNIYVGVNSSLTINIDSKKPRKNGRTIKKGSGRSDDILYEGVSLDDIGFQNILNSVNSIKSTHWLKLGDGQPGSSITFDVNSIFVDGNLYIKLFGGNGGSAYSKLKARDAPGGLGGYGGDVIFSVDTITNYNKLFLDINAGNGAKGGNGSGENNWGGGDPKNGGTGGFGGFVFLDVNNIYNYSNSAEMNIILNAGNGGSGGNHGNDVYGGLAGHNAVSGGHSGFGGGVYINSIDKVYNQGNLKLDIRAGDAGYIGGDQESDGRCGNGGYGGNVWPMNINKFYNYNDFNLSYTNGTLGYSGCNANHHSKNGLSGSLGSVNINYLENKSIDDTVIPKLSMYSKIYISKIKYGNLYYYYDTLNDLYQNNSDQIDEWPTSGNYEIKYLTSGSYLPYKLSINNPNFLYNLEKIDINGCYINAISPTEEQSINYKAKRLEINSSNPKYFSEKLTLDLKYPPVFNEVYCPHCEILDLQSIGRSNDDYYIYSNISGTINPYDLNIFYAYDDYPNINYIIPTPNNMELPVYSNKEEIQGEFDEELGLYKYLISKDKIRWIKKWDDTAFNFLDEDKLYCYGQQYYIKGKITKDNGEKVNFNFPFIPIHKN